MYSSNPGIKSIEEQLFKALVKTDAISKFNATDPKKVQLMRAARTDKGVHASCNLVSLKMICQDENLVEKLNAALPNHIRIWGKRYLCANLCRKLKYINRLCGDTTYISRENKV